MVMSRIAESKIGRTARTLAGIGTAAIPITYEMLNPPAIYAQEQEIPKDPCDRSYEIRFIKGVLDEQTRFMERTLDREDYFPCEVSLHVRLHMIDRLQTITSGSIRCLQDSGKTIPPEKWETVYNPLFDYLEKAKSSAYCMLGGINEVQNKYSKALENYERALEINPSNQECLSALKRLKGKSL